MDEADALSIAANQPQRCGWSPGGAERSGAARQGLTRRSAEATRRAKRSNLVRFPSFLFGGVGSSIRTSHPSGSSCWQSMVGFACGPASESMPRNVIGSSTRPCDCTDLWLAPCEVRPTRSGSRRRSHRERGSGDRRHVQSGLVWSSHNPFAGSDAGRNR